VLSEAPFTLIGPLHAHPLQTSINGSTTDALHPFRVQCTVALSDEVEAVDHNAVKFGPSHVLRGPAEVTVPTVRRIGEVENDR
jgi:hypothetical protein